MYFCLGCGRLFTISEKAKKWTAPQKVSIGFLIYNKKTIFKLKQSQYGNRCWEFWGLSF